MVHSTVCLQTDSDSILPSATLKMEAVHKEVWSCAGRACCLLYRLQSMIWRDIFSLDLCDLLIFALRLQLRTHVRSMSFASKGGLGSEMKSPLEIPAVILAKMDHALKAQQKHTCIHAKWLHSASGVLQLVHCLLIDRGGREIDSFLWERIIICWKRGNKAIPFLLYVVMPW